MHPAKQIPRMHPHAWHNDTLKEHFQGLPSSYTTHLLNIFGNSQHTSCLWVKIPPLCQALEIQPRMKKIPAVWKCFATINCCRPACGYGTSQSSPYMVAHGYHQSQQPLGYI